MSTVVTVGWSDLQLEDGSGRYLVESGAGGALASESTGNDLSAFIEYGTLELKNAGFSQSGALSFALTGTPGAFRVVEEMPVTLSTGGTLQYSGFVRHLRQTTYSGASAKTQVRYEVDCEDLTAILDRNLVGQEWQNPGQLSTWAQTPPGGFGINTSGGEAGAGNLKGWYRLTDWLTLANSGYGGATYNGQWFGRVTGLAGGVGDANGAVQFSQGALGLLNSSILLSGGGTGFPSAVPGAFQLDCWVNHQGQAWSAGTEIMISTNNTTALSVVNGFPTFVVAGVQADLVATATSALPTTGWHWIQANFDPTGTGFYGVGATLFVDGQQAARVSPNLTGTPLANPATAVTGFGCNTINVNNFYTGALDEVRVFTDGPAVYTFPRWYWNTGTDRALIIAAQLGVTVGSEAQTLFSPITASTGLVQTYPNALLQQPTVNQSAAQFLDQVMALTPGARWYVDQNNHLHTYLSENAPAPFGLSDAPDNSSSFGYKNLNLMIDATGIRNSVTYQGVLQSGIVNSNAATAQPIQVHMSSTFSDPTSIALYGTRAAVVRADTITLQSDLDTAAKAYIAANAYPTVTGQLLCFQGGLLPGQQVPFWNRAYQIPGRVELEDASGSLLLENGDNLDLEGSYQVTAVTTKFHNPAQPEYHIEFGLPKRTLAQGLLNLNAATASNLAARVAPLPTGASGNYAQSTSQQAGITTTVDLTSLTVTVNVVTGRRIRVSGYVPWASDTLNDVFFRSINEGATLLAFTNETMGSTSTSAYAGLVQVVLQPSAGSHTYKLQMGRSVGTGTGATYASPTNPAYILVEDIGT